MKNDTSLEKRRKIEALRQGGKTEGEREAAATALERVKSSMPVRITCTVMNIDAGETFYELQFRDVEDRPQTGLFAREHFQYPRRVVEQLLKVGASLPDDPTIAVEIIKNAINSKSDMTRRLTARPGWYEFQSFVYPNETFGTLAGRLTYESRFAIDPAFGLTGGSLKGWREGLREPCRLSDYLIMAISHKAANALLDVIGEDEGCIFHFHGTESDSTEKTASSSGKTLATRVAASMTGRCRKTDLTTFAVSEAALCDLSFARNNVGVELDEEGRSLGTGNSPRVKADQLSYLFTSGRGTVRSHYAMRHADLKNRTWLANGITSGELPLDSTSKRSARTEGSQVRMIGLPVPSGAKGGIYNRVKKRGKSRRKICKRLAERTETTISTNHGVAFPAMLRAIVPIRGTLTEQINAQIAKLITQVDADNNPWEMRFARKLAIAGATGMLLAKLQIAPWSQKRAVRAFRRIYRKARAAVSTATEIAERITTRIRRLLSNDKFPVLAKGKRLSRHTLKAAQNGFRKELPGIGLVLLMPMPSLEKLARRRGATSSALEHLAQQGIVHKGEDGKTTRQVLVKGLANSRHRYVCFDLAALGSSEG